MIYVAALAYLGAVVLICAINHASSVVSGNHEDPYRDVGNGGCTVEGSFRQHRREQQIRHDTDLINRLSRVF